MEISNLPEKMIISKKLSKVQEQRQLNGIRETIHLKNEKFNRNHKKTTPGAEEYKDRTEKFNKELRADFLLRRNNQQTWRQIIWK